MGLVINALNNRVLNNDEIPCIKFDSASNFKIRFGGQLGTKFQNRWNGKLYYSLDKINWYDADGNYGITTKTIYFYGVGNTSVVNSGARFNISEANDYIYCSGNICSLLDSIKVLNGENIDIFEGCFSQLFIRINLLKSAPELPSKIVGKHGYSSMFSYCTALLNCPDLPATSVGEYGYGEMFRGCTSLTNCNKLSATSVGDNGYWRMFMDCINLSHVQDNFPATSVGHYGYSQMFSGCKSLNESFHLPATTVGDYGYSGMFVGCISLEIPPALPATSIGQYAYTNMFNSCTSLKRIPQLSVTSIPAYAYRGMFQGCSQIGLKTTQDADYQYLFRIPQSGTATTGTNALYNMFADTKNTITVAKHTNYYTEQPLVT